MKNHHTIRIATRRDAAKLLEIYAPYVEKTAVTFEYEVPEVQEFEERIERTVTDEQYKVIEEVYMWHPSIRNTSGKDEVAELYKSFGMTIFHDMLPRAKKAHELDELLRNAQREVQRIQEEIEELPCPTLRVEE